MTEKIVNRDVEVPERAGERAPLNDSPAQSDNQRPAPLFADAELNGYRARWGGIQTGFVDEPRKAVEQADALVTELMRRLTDSFTSERQRLEEQWGRNQQASTEDLRQAMRRYRSFFERLLTI